MASKDDESIDSWEAEEGEPLTAEDEELLDEAWGQDYDDSDLEPLSESEVNDMID